MVHRVVRIDYNTETMSSGKFTRIAMEIDLTKPLVFQFKLDRKIQKVEYEALPQICFEFGLYGHVLSICPERKSPDSGNGENSMSEKANDPLPTKGKDEENSKFRAWMVVARKGRNQVDKARLGRGEIFGNDKGNILNGSRFNVLSNLENHENIANNDRDYGTNAIIPAPIKPLSNIGKKKTTIEKSNTGSSQMPITTANHVGKSMHAYTMSQKVNQSVTKAHAP